MNPKVAKILAHGATSLASLIAIGIVIKTERRMDAMIDERYKKPEDEETPVVVQP